MKKIISLLCITCFSLFCLSAGAVTLESHTGGESRYMTLEPDGQVPVILSDQTSPPLVVSMSRVTNSTSLTASPSIGDTTIEVAAATGMIAGAYITIADPISGRYWVGHQIGAIATLTITVDTPMDFAFPIGAEVSAGTHDMSSTAGTLASPVIYSVRAGEVTDVPVTIDITRIILTCTDGDAVAMNLFCGGAALTNGIVLRTTDGTTQNIFNVKTNQDLMNLAYDFEAQYVAGTPGGFDGMVTRLTFAGQNKMGVAIRIGPGEDLEILVQDDLTGITTFEVIAEGHVVIP